MFFFKNIESYLTLTLLRILSDTDRSTTLSGLRQPDSVVDLSVLKLLAHYVIGFFVLQKGSLLEMIPLSVYRGGVVRTRPHSPPHLFYRKRLSFRSEARNPKGLDAVNLIRFDAVNCHWYAVRHLFLIHYKLGTRNKQHITIYIIIDLSALSRIGTKYLYCVRSTRYW